jgi:hypothetical protein
MMYEVDRGSSLFGFSRKVPLRNFLSFELVFVECFGQEM